MAPRDRRSVNRCGHAHLACKFPINVSRQLPRSARRGDRLRNGIRVILGAGSNHFMMYPLARPACRCVLSRFMPDCRRPRDGQSRTRCVREKLRQNVEHLVHRDAERLGDLLHIINRRARCVFGRSGISHCEAMKSGQ